MKLALPFTPLSSHIAFLQSESVADRGLATFAFVPDVLVEGFALLSVSVTYCLKLLLGPFVLCLAHPQRDISPLPVLVRQVVRSRCL